MLGVEEFNKGWEAGNRLPRLKKLVNTAKCVPGRGRGGGQGQLKALMVTPRLSLY